MKITDEVRKLSDNDRFICLSYVYATKKNFDNNQDFRKFLKVIIEKTLQINNKTIFNIFETEYNIDKKILPKCLYCMFFLTQYPIIPKLRYR